MRTITNTIQHTTLLNTTTGPHRYHRQQEDHTPTGLFVQIKPPITPRLGIRSPTTPVCISSREPAHLRRGGAVHPPTTPVSRANTRQPADLQCDGASRSSTTPVCVSPREPAHLRRGGAANHPPRWRLPFTHHSCEPSEYTTAGLSRFRCNFPFTHHSSEPFAYTTAGSSPPTTPASHSNVQRPADLRPGAASRQPTTPCFCSGTQQRVDLRHGGVPHSTTTLVFRLNVLQQASLHHDAPPYCPFSATS